MGYSPRGMAKPKKDDQSRSVLKLAYEAFDRGDKVQARALAKEVVAGKVGRDDEKVAVELATLFSSDEAVIAQTPAAVAQEIIARTITAPKPYLFVGAIAFAFLSLVALAHFRY